MHQELLPNIVSFLQTMSPFDQLNADTLNAIAGSIEILYLGQHQHLEPLTAPPQHFLYIVRTGVIEQRYHDGSLRSRLGADDIFGFSQHDGAALDYQVVAIENSLLYRIDYPTLLTLVDPYPDVIAQLAPSISTRLIHSVSLPHPAQTESIFLQPVRKLASQNLVMVTPDTPIQQAADKMSREPNSSCAAIVDQQQRLIGLVTDKDMTKRVIAHGVDVQQPIATIMTHQLHTVSVDDLVMKASEIMIVHHIQNVPIVDDNFTLQGIITPQQLIQQNSIQAIFLSEKISQAPSLPALIALAAERNAIFSVLVENGVSSDVIGKVMSLIYDAFTCRLLALAEQHLGAAPCEYCWIAAGSHARNEVHLGSDQDNALILDDGATESDKVYFSHLAMYLCKGLDQCGYALCSGRFMAATRRWCQPLHVWVEYYRKWARAPEYEHLLNLNVFIEIRYIAGNKSLFDALNDVRLQQITHNPKLIAALVTNALRTRPPLGIFNNLVLKKDGDSREKTLDIKHAALSSLVDMARIYTLSEGGAMQETLSRLLFVEQKGLMSHSSYLDCLGIYHFVTGLRNKHQVEALQQGKPIDNLLQPTRFGSFERQHLKDAFRIVSGLQEALRIKFGQ